MGTSQFKSLTDIKVRHTYTIIHGLAVEFPAKYVDKVSKNVRHILGLVDEIPAKYVNKVSYKLFHTYSIIHGLVVEFPTQGFPLLNVMTRKVQFSSVLFHQKTHNRQQE